MEWAYSSVVEHYVDIVGVASSILATPTIPRKPVAQAAGFLLVDHAPRRPTSVCSFRFLRSITSAWPGRDQNPLVKPNTRLAMRPGSA